MCLNSSPDQALSLFSDSGVWDFSARGLEGLFERDDKCCWCGFDPRPSLLSLNSLRSLSLAASLSLNSRISLNSRSRSLIVSMTSSLSLSISTSLSLSLDSLSLISLISRSLCTSLSFSLSLSLSRSFSSLLGSLLNTGRMGKGLGGVIEGAGGEDGELSRLPMRDSMEKPWRLGTDGVFVVDMTATAAVILQPTNSTVNNEVVMY